MEMIGGDPASKPEHHYYGNTEIDHKKAARNITYVRRRAVVPSYQGVNRTTLAPS
jgi:hypothetical protein